MLNTLSAPVQQRNTSLTFEMQDKLAKVIFAASDRTIRVDASRICWVGAVNATGRPTKTGDRVLIQLDGGMGEYVLDRERFKRLAKAIADTEQRLGKVC